MDTISLLPLTAEYALRVVVWLAGRQSARATSRDISEATAIPHRYLYRVMRALEEAGVVTSRSGPGGGYCLARPAEQITMLDVVNAVGELARIRICPLGRGAEGAALCPLHRELDAAFALIEQAFARVTIGQLVDRSNAAPLCQAPTE